MLIDGYDKCPSCGRSLKDRVLIRLVDEQSKERDFICFSEQSWNWLQKTAREFGLDEGKIVHLFVELYLESVRISKLGDKYKIYYNDLTKMLNLFHG